MSPSVVILAVICIALGVVALRSGGPPLVGEALRDAGRGFLSVAPQLALGFTMAGLVTVLLPPAVIGRLVGADSGFAGLAIATAAGAVTPGGPFLQFPLVASLLKAGAGEGQVAAYLTAWSLLGLQRVFVWELPILGPTFTTVRWVASLAIPIVVGLVVPLLLRAARDG